MRHSTAAIDAVQKHRHVVGEPKLARKGVAQGEAQRVGDPRRFDMEGVGRCFEGRREGCSFHRSENVHSQHLLLDISPEKLWPS